jgi:hypothetical protein
MPPGVCSEPATSDLVEPGYVERVREVHSRGGHGSQGYGYNWKHEEAAKVSGPHRVLTLPPLYTRSNGPIICKDTKT